MRLLHCFWITLMLGLTLTVTSVHAESEAEDGKATFMVLGQAVEVAYEWLHGDMVAGGDVVLDPSWRIENDDPQSSIAVFGFSQSSGFWPNALVPYAIHSSVRSTHRTYIRKAIEEFEAKTSIRWVKRSGQKAFVQFIELDNGACRAEPGHTGGRRRVKLRNGGTCNQGVVTHEMGHSLGLLHEQNRSDAKQYVRNLTGCLDGTGNNEVGRFDICSTMLYRSTTLGSCNIKLKAGTVSGRCPGSETCPGGSACSLLHDWSTLSQGDVATLDELYPSQTEPDPEPDPEPNPEPNPDPEPDPEFSGDLGGGCGIASKRGGTQLAFLFILLSLAWRRKPRPHDS